MIDEYAIHHHDSIGSTMDEVRRLAQAGAPTGTVVHADRQEQGRGRLARNWVSPAGNLYMSILLRTDQPAHRSVEVSFLTALAVAETLRAMLPAKAPLRLKWPNDVLVDDAKICGILLEQAEDVLIIGIGVNILEAPSIAAYRTTTVAAQGGIASVDGARDMLLDRFRDLTRRWAAEGFAPIRDAWLALTYPPGAPLRVNAPDGALTGRFAGLDLDGALLLETDDGVRRILAGDVSA